MLEGSVRTASHVAHRCKVQFWSRTVHLCTDAMEIDQIIGPAVGCGFVKEPSCKLAFLRGMPGVSFPRRASFWICPEALSKLLQTIKIHSPKFAPPALGSWVVGYPGRIRKPRPWFVKGLLPFANAVSVCKCSSPFAQRGWHLDGNGRTNSHGPLLANISPGVALIFWR